MEENNIQAAEIQGDSENLSIQVTLKCSKCGQEKSADRKNFNVAKKSKTGFSKWCKVCKKLNNRERYEKLKTVITYNVRSWQRRNKEKTLKYKRDWAARKIQKSKEEKK